MVKLIIKLKTEVLNTKQKRSQLAKVNNTNKPTKKS